MRVHAPALLVTLGLLAGSVAAVSAQTPEGPPERQLQLSFDANGQVTLRAQNVAVREVLAEWARQCGCFVVNAQGLNARVDMPMQFEQQPQEQVLKALLRQAAGYVLTPSRQGAAGPSKYETIYVLATSNPSAASAYVPPAPLITPMAPSPGTPESEIPPVTPIPTLPNPSTPPASQPTADTPAPPAPAPRAPGTPGRFVPIVPIGPGSNAPRTTPGGVTPAPNSAPVPPQPGDAN